MSIGCERSTGEVGFRGRLCGLLGSPSCCGVLTELLGSKGCLGRVVVRSVEAEVSALDFDRNELYASELPEGCCEVWNVSWHEQHNNSTLTEALRFCASRDRPLQLEPGVPLAAARACA